ncbi:hypothetical protein [Gordonia polyisoprenivorans]|uniref:hypothetical protein n=1 Tax=Gordonia polyisoprenivorans TaxID=84595 RepID=UPI00035F038B|nr:hypothetical protein [Gordonia polyisoprenivorans]
MYKYGLDDLAAEEHLNRQLATIEIIASLQVQIDRPPASASDVARLDEDLGDIPVKPSQSIHRGLSTAKDCLVDLSRVLGSNSSMSLSSARALMRTALMGASRAAFVLVPDDHGERRANAATVVRQEWFSLQRAMEALHPFEELKGLVPPEDFRADMKAKSENLSRGPRMGEEKTIREMSEVAAKRLGGQDSSSVLTESLVWIWHSASGAAHAYGWPTMAGGDFIADFGMVVPVVHLAVDTAVKRWS